MTPSPEAEGLGHVYVSIQVENKEPEIIVLDQPTALPNEKSKEELVQENFQLMGQQLEMQQVQVEPPSFVCEWMPTHIRLASSSKNQGPSSAGNNPEGEISPYLCLPVRCSVSCSAQSDENEDSKCDEQRDGVASKLRLKELDHYLASAPSLAATAQILLAGEKAIPDAHNATLDARRSNASVEAKNHHTHNRRRRSKYDRHRTQQATVSRHRLVTSTNSGRVLNVLQGEIAHCTPQQADVVISDDATTCHIVALWSRYVDCGGNAHPGKRKHDGLIPEGGAVDGILASMTHIDGAGYHSSLREAVLEHFMYHSKKSNHNCPKNLQPVQDAVMNEEKDDQVYGGESYSCKHHNSAGDDGTIEMSIHIMGGFNDDDGSSIEITDDVLRAISALAKEFGDYFSFDTTVYPAAGGPTRIRMTLETCVVSSANDDGTGCPIGRGLAMEVMTGKVFLAEVEESRPRVMHPSSPITPHSSRSSSPFSQATYYSTASLSSRDGVGFVSVDGDVHLMDIGMDMTNDHATYTEGPEVVLRGVRLWAAAFHPCSENQQQKLVVIHLPHEDFLYIQPFAFGPHSYARDLLRLNDAQLLQFTSTSPKVEKSNFPYKVRETLSFMNSTVSSRVFAKLDEPIKYRRIGLNGWALCESDRDLAG